MPKHIFFRFISFPELININRISTLTQLTVKRIIKSPQKWSKLVALAKDWMNTSRIFRSISSSPTIEALSVFSERVAECLKLEPSGKLELFSSIPCGLQYIERANHPLLVFREAKKL